MVNGGVGEHLAFSNIVVSAGAAAVVLLKDAAEHLRWTSTPSHFSICDLIREAASPQWLLQLTIHTMHSKKKKITTKVLFCTFPLSLFWPCPLCRRQCLWSRRWARRGRWRRRWRRGGRGSPASWSDQDQIRVRSASDDQTTSLMAMFSGCPSIEEVGDRPLFRNYMTSFSKQSPFWTGGGGWEPGGLMDRAKEIWKRSDNLER